MKKTLSKTGDTSSQKTEPESEDTAAQKSGPRTEIKRAESGAAVQKAADQAQNDDPKRRQSSQSTKGMAQDRGKEVIQRTADQAQSEISETE